MHNIYIYNIYIYILYIIIRTYMHIIHYNTRVFYMTKNSWIPMQTDTIAGFWSPTCQKTHIFIPLISPRQVEHGLTFSSPGSGTSFSPSSGSASPLFRASSPGHPIELGFQAWKQHWSRCRHVQYPQSQNRSSLLFGTGPSLNTCGA